MAFTQTNLKPNRSPNRPRILVMRASDLSPRATVGIKLRIAGKQYGTYIFSRDTVKARATLKRWAIQTRKAVLNHAKPKPRWAHGR